MSIHNIQGLLGLNLANSGGQPFNFQGLLGGYADPRMAALQGAGQAASRFAGYQPRPVSLGQMIGAMGGAAQQGALGANQQNFANYGQAMNMQMLRQKMQGTQAARELATQKRVALQKWGEGEARRATDPATAERIRMDPGGWLAHQRKLAEKDPRRGMSSAKKYALDMGLVPDTPEFTKAMAAFNMKGQVSIDMKGESAERIARGQALVKRETAIIDAADNARETMAYTGMARAIVSRPGNVPTEWGQLIGNFAISVGIPMTKEQMSKVTTGQSFQGIMGNILAAKLNAATGPQTDRDADRLKKTLATLGNTPEAKTFLMDASDAMSRRAIAKETFLDEYMARNKGSSRGAKAEWNKTTGNVPLFGVNPVTGRPLFYDEFRETIKQSNKGIKEAKIKALWIAKYAK